MLRMLAAKASQAFNYTRTKFVSSVNKKDPYEVAMEKMKDVSKDSPNAAQGLWQAIGQIRAAKITGLYTVAATGVLGAGLASYERYLSKRAKEVEEIESRALQAIASSGVYKEALEVKEAQIKEGEKELKNNEAIIWKYKQLFNSYESIVTDHCVKQANDSRCADYNELAKTVNQSH